MKRYRCRPAIRDRLHKRCSTLFLTLVLAPENIARKPRPTEAPQPTEILKLQDRSTTVDLEALLREGTMAVGQVMNCSDRTILEVEHDINLVIAHTAARSKTRGV